MNNVYNITAVILAAGEGKRMYSKIPKVLHKLCGLSMVEHVINSAKEIGCQEPVVVIGHGADQVKEAIKDVRFVMQEKQMGTGHAVMQAEEYIHDNDILVLYGDTPLVSAEKLNEMYQFHKAGGYGVTVLTAELDNPAGYGRIVRDSKGLIDAIVEDKDANQEVKEIKEINSGMYFFKGTELKKALKKLTNNNAQGEYYLTDALQIIRAEGFEIAAFKTDDPAEIMGVNNKLQLSEAAEIMRSRICKSHMLAGVSIIDPKNTYIDKTVKISRDVTIYPGCILEGSTIIEEDCIIGPNSRIKDSILDKKVNAQNSVILESKIGEATSVGPFAYLRPGNVIGKNAKIGDFVEMKNSIFGDNSKASHLTYVGDAEVGSNVNLGCGVVFVNYDGKKKYKTVVEDNCFVGCNVNLVAPVTVKKDSYVAAGTTVTKDVPEGSLSIGRVRQENKEGWIKNSNQITKE
ncbi:MAG: glmU [Clostridia bacterium]|jgi:bifunctional UDP-N-acetylglucosamine pyrophosphorylase/glucosamine-1-phosphate N-acetyltransferase|nr:glmU [Clostridia bacterium]